MASGKSNNFNYKSLSSTKKRGKAGSEDLTSITPPKRSADRLPHSQSDITEPPSKTDHGYEVKSRSSSGKPVLNGAAKPLATQKAPEKENLSFAENKKAEKKVKKSEKDAALLGSDHWIFRNGHALTFVGVYLFSIFVFFRPYELVPALGFLSSGAFIIALATLAVYVPSQVATEGNLTILTTEIKCVLAMALLALALLPISRDFAAAWETFNDPFIKAVLIFIVMINVVRTRQRLMALLWIAISISIYLSYAAIDLYLKGDFRTEGYRVSVDVKGMFENPNEMSLHLVTMIPIIIALGLATKKKGAKIFYLLLATLLVGANVVTFSRGGFLGFIASMAVFVWKAGRDSRVKTSVLALTTGLLLIVFAPGGYGIRLLSIFVPGLDPVGSSDQRRENLILSIIVTLRNPWGIGIGNSPTFGVRNLETHNAFTQVSSELGLLGFAAYMILMISPFRKLGVIERTLYEKGEREWFYYLSIGLQASIVGYMVSSFFASIAYLWFIYYLIAYAVAFRRIYQTENNLHEEVQAQSFRQSLWSTKTA